MHENESIEDKLKALGVQLGGKNIAPPKKTPRFRIEDVIRVKTEETPFGSIFVYEEHFPLSYRHGEVNLNAIDQFKIIAKWANLGLEKASDMQSLLFLDTETSGISRGTGTFAFMVGLGFYRQDGFHLRQLIMPDPYLEPALLAVLARYTESCEYIVSYNGKSFDIPLLENRHIMHRLPSPFAGKQHIDLLHLARKLWRNRLASRRLGDLENHILSFSRTKDDIPGWLVPEIYKEYLHTGDARPLSGVFYHNAIDILSLAGVFVHVANLLHQPHAGNIIDLDLAAVGTIFEDMGSYEAAKQIYRECMDKDLPPQLFAQTIRRFAAIHKKAQEWENAVSLWQIAADHDVDACIELAKYYEHQAKQTTEAVFWTKKGLEINAKNAGNSLDFLKNDLEHRLARLVLKQNQSV